MILDLVLRGGCRSACIGLNHGLNRNAKKWVSHLTGLANYTPLASGDSESADMVSLEPHRVASAAELIRGQRFVEESDEIFGMDSRNDVLAWLDSMAQHTADSLRHIAGEKPGRIQKKGVSAYTVEPLIQSIRLAQLLRRDSDMLAKCKSVCEILGMGADLIREDATMPSKTTISRDRFTLDCGLAVLWKEYWRDLFNSNIDLFVAFLADSSPRAGKEWLLMEMYILHYNPMQRHL